MLLPDSAEMKIAQQPHLSKEALLSLTSLLVTLPDIQDRVHDNLLQTSVDGCKGGHRAATTTSGPEDRKEDVAVPIDVTVRTELIDLMARILMTVFQAEEGGR